MLTVTLGVRWKPFSTGGNFGALVKLIEVGN